MRAKFKTMELFGQNCTQTVKLQTIYKNWTRPQNTFYAVMVGMKIKDIRKVLTIGLDFV